MPPPQRRKRGAVVEFDNSDDDNDNSRNESQIEESQEDQPDMESLVKDAMRFLIVQSSRKSSMNRGELKKFLRISSKGDKKVFTLMLAEVSFCGFLGVLRRCCCCYRDCT